MSTALVSAFYDVNDVLYKVSYRCRILLELYAKTIASSHFAMSLK